MGFFILFIFLFVFDLAHSIIKITNGRTAIDTNDGDKPPGVFYQGLILLPKNLTRAKIGEEIIFQLKSNFTVTGIVDRVDSQNDARFTWSGNLTDRYGAYWYLSYKDGCVVAMIDPGIEVGQNNSADSIYRITSVDFTLGEYKIEEVGLANFRDSSGDNDQDVVIGGKPFSPSGLSDDGDYNRIMDMAFLYTPQVIEEMGSIESIETTIDLAVSYTNVAFENSLIDLRVRQIYAGRILQSDYVEEGFREEMMRMSSVGDGYFDEEVAELAAKGADVITLFVASRNYCGYGYVQYSDNIDVRFMVNVVSIYCPASVAHEMGHNVGCDHNRDSAINNDQDKFFYGFCWDTAPGPKGCQRSVLAYASCRTPSGKTNCPRTLNPHFSNPAVIQGLYNSPTGASPSAANAGANNAQVFINKRDIITTLRKSTQEGGVVTIIFPQAAVGAACPFVRIKGWSLGLTGSDINYVSLNGVPVVTIIEQTKNEVLVIAGQPTEDKHYGIGDLIVSTVSGYNTTYKNYFRYERDQRIATQDYELGNVAFPWTETGALKFEPKSICVSLDCDSNVLEETQIPTEGGPAAGQGSKYGFFSRVLGTSKGSDTAELTALFNQDSSTGCTDIISEFSFYYHMYASSVGTVDCHGTLSAQVQYDDGAWETVLQATDFQPTFNSPWKILEFTAPANGKLLTGLKIIVKPYSYAKSGQCSLRNAIAIDTVSYTATTTCTGESLCNSKLPTLPPSMPPIIQKFLDVDVVNTNSGSNENTTYLCVEVTSAIAELTVQTFHDECYDTRVGNGDTYIRLRRDTVNGEQLAENDDVDYPACSDSIITREVTTGRYCAMLGCLADDACAYNAKVTVTGTGAVSTAPTAAGPEPVMIDTPVFVMTGTNSASNYQAAAFCFNVPYSQAIVTVSSYHDVCYDTRGEGYPTGDSYMRLRRNAVDGVQVAENDDVDYPDCMDSRLAANVPSGRYCLMMGCLANTACSYSGRIKISEKIYLGNDDPNFEVRDTGVIDVSRTNSGSNENSASMCFVINQRQIVTVQTFHDECYDTKVGNGDTYIRLRRDTVNGEQLAENDDVDYPACSDSKIEIELAAGRYCFIMGCWGDTACSFDGRVVTQSDLGGGGDLPQGNFSIITDVVEVSFTNSAKKSDRVGSYCFPVNQSSVVTAQSFLTDCHDTRPAGADPKGDPYLRLLANDVEGELVVENDDVDSTCSGAALRDLFLQKGTYCLMMGCYGCGRCAYASKISITPMELANSAFSKDDKAAAMDRRERQEGWYAALIVGIISAGALLLGGIGWFTYSTYAGFRMREEIKSVKNDGSQSTDATEIFIDKEMTTDHL